MRCVYLDEAGLGDEKHEPIAVVAAVLVEPDVQWKSLEADVDSIIKNLELGENGGRVEFHAKELFSGRPNTRQTRHRILKTFLELFPKHKLLFFPGSVHRAEVRKTLSVNHSKITQRQLDLATHGLAFLQSIQLVNLWLRSIIPKETGLCLADETSRERVAWLKAELRYFQRVSISADWDNRFQKIIDTVYFADSRDSFGLQLADAASFLTKRHLMGKRDSESFYEIIKGQMINPLGTHHLKDPTES